MAMRGSKKRLFFTGKLLFSRELHPETASQIAEASREVAKAAEVKLAEVKEKREELKKALDSILTLSDEITKLKKEKVKGAEKSSVNMQVHILSKYIEGMRKKYPDLEERLKKADSYSEALQARKKSLKDNANYLEDKYNQKELS